MSRPHIPLVDIKQTFWQLAFIQGAAMGLPIILVGARVAVTYGRSAALLSIVIGNLILWLIGLVMILMTPRHENAIENVANYLGKTSKYIAAIILTIAFLGWFSLQTKSVAELAHCRIGLSNAQEIKFGSALGFIIALISMGGIRFIKRLTCICFPILMVLLMVITFYQRGNGIPCPISQGLTFSSIMIVVASILPGIINLPTFFRHSKSKAHSIGGLSLMMAINGTVQMMSIFWGVYSSEGFCNLPISLNVLLSFSLISLVCTNLVNIYFAAAAWEAITLRSAGAKGYAIFGLIGTLFFCALQALSPMSFLENLVNSFIACLGIVLLVAFLISVLVSHRHRRNKYEKLISNIAWFVGCAASLIVLVKNSSNVTESLIWGICFSLFTFLVIVFAEETLWSIKKLCSKNQSK